MSNEITAQDLIPEAMPAARRHEVVDLLVQTVEPPVIAGNAFTGKFFSLAQVLATPDNADWLFPDLLCRGDTMMLYGDSGAGKSFVALDMAFALAAGVPWCNGLFVPTSPRRVLYCVGEGKPRCKCARGFLHGPYYYRFYRDRFGRQHRQYITKAEAEAALQQQTERRAATAVMREFYRQNWADYRRVRAEINAMLKSYHEMQRGAR